MLPKQSQKLLDLQSIKISYGCLKISCYQIIIDTTLKFEEISYFRIVKMLVKLEEVKNSQIGYTEPD